MWKWLMRRHHVKTSPEIEEAAKVVYAAIQDAQAVIQRIADSDAEYARRHQRRR